MGVYSVNAIYYIYAMYTLCCFVTLGAKTHHTYCMQTHDWYSYLATHIKPLTKQE